MKEHAARNKNTNWDQLRNTVFRRTDRYHSGPLSSADHPRNNNISIDNEATILILHQNRPQSAQYLIDKIKADVARIHSEETERKQRTGNAIARPSISITWVAGHVGSEGNEAKEAAPAIDTSQNPFETNYPLASQPPPSS